MATSTVESSPNPQPASSSPANNNRMLIYIAAGVVVLIIIGALFLYTLKGPSTSPITTTTAITTTSPTSNATPIYLSPIQSEQILGSQIVNYTENYSTGSLYNQSSFYNVTFLESIVPAFSGNITNGWETTVFGSSSNNASMIYLAIQTNNAGNMSSLMASAIASSFTTVPNVDHGLVNGLNYTYESESNLSESFQALIGWKDGYVSVVQIVANRYVSNQTQIAQIVSSTLP